MMKLQYYISDNGALPRNVHSLFRPALQDVLVSSMANKKCGLLGFVRLSLGLLVDDRFMPENDL